MSAAVPAEATTVIPSALSAAIPAAHAAERPYNDRVVRQFTIMTVVWGIIGMSVGALIAAQLIWPALAVGYLPARGVALPAGLGWLETVVRTALTPAALLVILVLLVVPLWRGWRPRPGPALAGDRPVADRTAPRG